ncbi:unnamed protein product, partial [Prorocentrum cordatum]
SCAPKRAGSCWRLGLRAAHHTESADPHSAGNAPPPHQTLGDQAMPRRARAHDPCICRRGGRTLSQCEGQRTRLASSSPFWSAYPLCAPVFFYSFCSSWALSDLQWPARASPVDRSLVHTSRAVLSVCSLAPRVRSRSSRGRLCAHASAASCPALLPKRARPLRPGILLAPGRLVGYRYCRRHRARPRAAESATSDGAWLCHRVLPRCLGDSSWRGRSGTPRPPAAPSSSSLSSLARVSCFDNASALVCSARRPLPPCAPYAGVPGRSRACLSGMHTLLPARAPFGVCPRRHVLGCNHLSRAPQSASFSWTSRPRSKTCVHRVRLRWRGPTSCGWRPPLRPGHAQADKCWSPRGGTLGAHAPFPA